MNELLLNKGEKQWKTNLKWIFSGACAGCVAWTGTYPIDVISTRMSASK